MATYAEQMQSIFQKYQAAGNPSPATSKEVAAWAIAQGLWKPKPDDAITRCAEDLSRALREEYRTDARGRRYRAKHVVRERREGKQLFLWADMETAPRGHMSKAIAQRRRQIVGDCHQLKVDVDVYNDLRSDQEPLQVVFDFTDDLAEIEALEEIDNLEAA